MQGGIKNKKLDLLINIMRPQASLTDCYKYGNI